MSAGCLNSANSAALRGISDPTRFQGLEKISHPLVPRLSHEGTEESLEALCLRVKKSPLIGFSCPQKTRRPAASTSCSCGRWPQCTRKRLTKNLPTIGSEQERDRVPLFLSCFHHPLSLERTAEGVRGTADSFQPLESKPLRKVMQSAFLLNYRTDPFSPFFFMPHRLKGRWQIDEEHCQPGFDREFLLAQLFCAERKDRFLKFVY